MKKLVLCLSLLFFCVGIGVAYAADDPVLPTEFKLDKKDDLSALMVSSFFDDVWKDLVGGDVDKESSKYARLILAIFSALNFAAVIYVGAMIFYIWGVAAATTAHEGEVIGGSRKLFNSFWVPVRHASAFALTIPVFKGLSLMQIAIIACVGISINMANSLWHYAAANIIRNVDVRSADIFTRAMATDAYDVAPFLFRDFVSQRVFTDYRIKNKDKKHIWKNNYNGTYEHEGKLIDYAVLEEKMPDEISYPVNFDGKFDKDGKMFVQIDFESGKIVIKSRPNSILPTMYISSIIVDFPRWKCSYLKNGIFNKCAKPTGKNYEMMEQISLGMVKSILRFCETLDGIAEDYLKTDYGGCSVLNGATCTSGDGLGRKAIKQISDAAARYLLENKKNVASIVEKQGAENASQWKNTLAQAMGIRKWESDDATSEFGWISAGLFPMIIVSAEQRIRQGFDIQMGIDNSPDYGNLLEILDDGFSFLDPRYRTAIANAAQFAVNYMAQDGYYVGKRLAQSDDDTLLDKLKEGLVKSFGGTDTNHAGALGFVLKKAGKDEPVLLLAEFGDKILSAGEVIFVTGIGAKIVGFAAKVVGYATGTAVAGEVADMVLSAAGTIAIMASLGLISTGVFFAYVVPALPAFFWIIAVFSWFFLIVESLVAAPFWVCTHAATRGVGFAGDYARTGYLMLFDIMARPALLVTGVVIAIILSQICGTFVEKMFNLWFASDISEISFVADIVYAIIVSSVLYYVYYKIFTAGILYVPNRVVKWCGQVASRFGNEVQGLQQTIAAGGATGQIKSLATKTPGIGSRLLPRIPSLSKPGMK